MTPAQIATLKAALVADTNLATQKAAHDTQGIADYLNADSTFVVWRSSTAADDISDAITWASLTPTDAPDATVPFTNRILVCQTKQMALQQQLLGKTTVNTGKANIRAAFQDALLAVPSGAGGATVDAGWLGAGKVKAAISRAASRLEKIFATGTGTAASPGTLVVETQVSELTIRQLAWADDGTWLL